MKFKLIIVMVADEKNVLLKEGDMYRLNPDEPLPTDDYIQTHVDSRFHDLGPFFGGIFRNTPARLRGQQIVFDSLEKDGRELTDQFHDLLGNRIYTAMRNAAFAALPRQERAWLRGKKLLDAGCGSGRETAELWLHLGGNVEITAIDPLPGMLKLAEANFDALVEYIEPQHPPINNHNRPTFREASITRLPFEDNSFDAAFYSQVLHFASDPRSAIGELVRVVKPEGVIFGSQGAKPHASAYLNIYARTSENCYGFAWVEDYQRWYAEHGFQIEVITPAGIFRARRQ